VTGVYRVASAGTLDGSANEVAGTASGVTTPDGPAAPAVVGATNSAHTDTTAATKTSLTRILTTPPAT
jgi:hypothetical protein